jgi:hypothetical protein
MPRATDRSTDNDSLIERGPIVRTPRADGEELALVSYEQNFFTANVPDETFAIGNSRAVDALREVRPFFVFLFVFHRYPSYRDFRYSIRSLR